MEITGPNLFKTTITYGIIHNTKYISICNAYNGSDNLPQMKCTYTDSKDKSYLDIYCGIYLLRNHNKYFTNLNFVMYVKIKIYHTRALNKNIAAYIQPHHYFVRVHVCDWSTQTIIHFKHLAILKHGPYEIAS